MQTLDRSLAAALASTHKLVGFGAGELGLRTLRFLDGHVEYFVDNGARTRPGPWEGGVPVRAVESLAEEDVANLVVVLCTEHRDAARAQLDEIAPGARVMQTPLLRDHDIFDRLRDCSSALLVSAYGAEGGVYLVNGRRGTHRRLARGSFRGLVIIGGRLVVATERGDLALVRSLDPWDAETLYRAETTRQVHGLAWWPRGGRLFVAEARTDTIAVHEASTLKLIERRPLSDRTDGGRGDWHHANDLCVVDDRLLVSVISARGWWQHGIYDGAVLEHDPNGGAFTPLLSDLHFPHSIGVIGDRLAFLESTRGNLRFGDHVAMRFPGFVRGLTGDPSCVYVGQSRNRRLGDARDLDAVSMDSGLYVADPTSRVFRFLPLPAMCDVYDILDLETTSLDCHVPHDDH